MYCVITTINHPTKAIQTLYEKFGKKLIVVGDKKTPVRWNYFGIEPIRYADKLYAPDNHYARKNLGYLEAMRNKAQTIIEADDDSCPNIKWETRSNYVDTRENTESGWFNVYKALSEEHIWPRGFSLRELSKPATSSFDNLYRTSSIQQELVDGDPDVDAIWRLVLKKEHLFTKDASIYLKPLSWCPFNSQATQWFPKAYPLMYLPSYSSFRMTDIWRSFVAQRCLWEIGEGVTFHSPSTYYQDRNEHDLLKDFEDEFPGYINNDKIVKILEGLSLRGGVKYVCYNMLICYEALISEGILPREEMDSLQQWIKDYEDLTRTA